MEEEIEDKEYIEDRDYKFLTCEQFENIYDSKDFDFLLKLKIFNDKDQSELNRTVYLKINHKDEHKIQDCIKAIQQKYFFTAKSFFHELIPNQFFIL